MELTLSMLEVNHCIGPDIPKYFFCLTDDSNTDDGGDFQTAFMKQIQNLIIPLLVIGMFFSSFPFGSREEKQVCR